MHRGFCAIFFTFRIFLGINSSFKQAIENLSYAHKISNTKRKSQQITDTMIDTSKIIFTPRLLKRRIFKKEKLNSRREAESPPRPRRRVSFSDAESVHSTISRDEFSSEEIDNSWYSSDEFLSIRMDNNRVVRNIRAGLCEVDSLESEARGLEHKTRTRMRQRETMITDAMLAVLEEQDIQEAMFGVVVDTKQIAKTYGRICKASQLAAVKRAEIDARIVHGDRKNENEQPSSSRTSKRRRSRGNVFDVLKTKRSSTKMDHKNFGSLVLLK